jgi:hypothetical protein
MSGFTRFQTSILFSALIMNQVHATSTFPRGCEVSGFAYSQNYLILNETGKQSYYLIQNNSNEKIELEHQSLDEAFMSPPLHANFESKSWGAFASDVKNLNFKCYKRSNEETSVVDCRDVLDVCEYPRVRFALSNMGNYWVAFNKSQNAVIQESVAKGIYLKW